MVTPIQDGIDLIGYFADIALGDPVSAVLLAFGFLFVIVPSVILFGLAAGGIVDWVIPENLGRSPPQRGR